MPQRIVFTAQNTAQLAPYEPDPKPLAPREVAGLTQISLISPGTELALYQGFYHNAGIPWGKFPCLPGYACVFRVESLGSEVTDLRPGDLAFTMGKHATHQRAIRDEIIPIPANLPLELAPYARLMNIAMTTLTTTRARPPENVLITGLGLVGFLAALVFQAAGYNVIGVDPDDSRRQIAQRAGIKHTLPAVPHDNPALANKIALVLECASHEQAVLDGCKIVQKGGEVVLVGTAIARKTQIYAQEILDFVFRNHVLLRSGREWELPRQPTDFQHNSYFGNLNACMNWLADGAINLAAAGPLHIVHSPADPQAVYQKLLRREIPALAVLLDWRTL